MRERTGGRKLQKEKVSETTAIMKVSSRQGVSTPSHLGLIREVSRRPLVTAPPPCPSKNFPVFAISLVVLSFDVILRSSERLFQDQNMMRWKYTKQENPLLGGNRKIVLKDTSGLLSMLRCRKT